MFSPQIDAWIYSQPQWVWVCVLLAVAALAYRFDWFSKLKGKVKSPVDRSPVKYSDKYSEPLPACYGQAVVAPTVLEGLLPPAVVEMRKSTSVMKQQLADAVAAETEATVKEYTKYMTLTTGVALATQKPTT